MTDALSCWECGSRFVPRKSDQVFCCTAHRQAWHRRRAERGAALYDVAMAWRAERHAGGFTAISRRIDGWLRDDHQRAPGRRYSTGLTTMTRMADGWLRDDRERASARRGKATS